MKVIFTSTLLSTVILTTQAYAGQCPPGSSAGECFEVSAPDLSEGGGTPGTIGGSIGLPSTGGGGAALSGGSINAKGKKSAQDSKTKKEDDNAPKDETNWFDTLIGYLTPELEAIKQAWEKIAEVSIHADSTETKRIIRRDRDTGNVIEEETIEKCKSAGVNDDKPSCTELKKTPWKDPSDGQKKMIITVSEFEVIKNPNPGRFGKKFIPKYLNSFQFVAKGPEDVYAFYNSLQQ